MSRLKPSRPCRISVLLLDEAGSRLEHICKIVVYLVDARYREPVYRVIGKWLKGVYPVSTGLGGLRAGPS